MKNLSFENQLFLQQTNREQKRIFRIFKKEQLNFKYIETNIIIRKDAAQQPINEYILSGTYFAIEYFVCF